MESGSRTARFCAGRSSTRDSSECRSSSTARTRVSREALPCTRERCRRAWACPASRRSPRRRPWRGIFSWPKWWEGACTWRTCPPHGTFRSRGPRDRRRRRARQAGSNREAFLETLCRDLLGRTREGLRSARRHARPRLSRQCDSLRSADALARGPLPVRVPLSKHALRGMGPRRCGRRDDRRGPDRLEARDVNDVQGPKSRVQSRGALAVALIGIAALTTEGNATPPRRIAIHYRVASGDLTKSGRFARGSASLAIARPSDRDEIATRENFFGSLTQEERAGVRWRFRDSERAGVARWEPVLKRYLGKAPGATILVCLFPDPATKARYTGSSRPADLSWSENDIQVDLDISAPREPDSISPVLASAALAARDKRLLARPTLLAALGARACGRWWGRDVASFAAFAREARVEPAEAQVLVSDPDVSPVLAVGAAASWIDAGIEQEGEPAVVRTLAEAGAPLESAL